MGILALRENRLTGSEIDHGGMLQDLVDAVRAQTRKERESCEAGGCFTLGMVVAGGLHT